MSPKMLEYEHENNRKSLIDHPGFTDVCLNEFVLNTASLGLKTKSHRSYASVYREGQKTRSELGNQYKYIVTLLYSICCFRSYLQVCHIHEGRYNAYIFRFFPAVSYRQLVRFVWDFTGSSRHLPLPCCSYNKIRSTFPS